MFFKFKFFQDLMINGDPVINEIELLEVCDVHSE